MLQPARTSADHPAGPSGDRRSRIVHRLRWVNSYFRSPKGEHLDYFYYYLNNFFIFYFLFLFNYFD